MKFRFKPKYLKVWSARDCHQEVYLLGNKSNISNNNDNDDDDDRSDDDDDDDGDDDDINNNSRLQDFKFGLHLLSCVSARTDCLQRWSAAAAVAAESASLASTEMGIFRLLPEFWLFDSPRGHSRDSS